MLSNQQVTEAMIEAGIEAWQKVPVEHAFDYSVVVSSIYTAMQSAQPTEREPHPVPEVQAILIAPAGIEKLKALRKMCEACRQGFYVEILDEVLALSAQPLPSGYEELVEKAKIAFEGAIWNTIISRQMLDQDTTDEIVVGAWEAFEPPFKEAVSALLSKLAEVERERDALQSALNYAKSYLAGELSAEAVAKVRRLKPGASDDQ